jgi:hypothetical protein
MSLFSPILNVAMLCIVGFDLAPSRFFALFFMDPELVPHVIDLAKVAL